MPSSAWSTTFPTASSSFRQGMTTVISGSDDMAKSAADRSTRQPSACTRRAGADTLGRVAVALPRSARRTRVALARAVRRRAPRRSALVVVGACSSTRRSRSRFRSRPGAISAATSSSTRSSSTTTSSTRTRSPRGLRERRSSSAALLDAGPQSSRRSAQRFSTRSRSSPGARSRDASGRPRRSRPRRRCSCTPATWCSSTSSRATPCSRRRSRSSPGCSLVRSSGRAPPARPRSARACRGSRPRPPGRAGAAPVRARPAARRHDVARAAAGLGRVRRSLRSSRCSPGRRTTPSAPTTSRWRVGAARRFRSSARSSPIDIVRAGERSCDARARARGRARPAALRALPLVRDRPRAVLLVAERAHARGPDRSLGPRVGLGRRLPAPRARRPRGGARASGHVRARGRARSRDLLVWPLYAPVDGHRKRRPSTPSARRRPAAARCRARASRSRPRASRATSRRRTGGSARCGRRRPSIRSSSRDRLTPRARPRSTAASTISTTAFPTVRLARSGSTG